MNILIGFFVVLFVFVFYRGLKSIYQDLKNFYDFKIKNSLTSKEIIDEKVLNEKKKIIGIGGGGSNIVESFSKQFNSLIINSDKKALEQKRVKNKIHLEKPDNLGCGSNEKCGFSLITNEVLNQIDKFVGTNKSITIIATLGGGVGSGSTKAIAQYLSNKNIKLNCILVKPFFWEGTKKSNRATETIEFLNQLKNINIIEIENDELRNYDHLSLSNAFNLLNNRIRKYV